MLIRMRDKKGKLVPDKTINDTEIVPFNYDGGIEAYLENEVHPYAPNAWIVKATPHGRYLNMEKDIIIVV